MTLIAELSLEVPHGVIFLHDAEANDIEIPPDTSAGPVTITKTCVAVWCEHEQFGATNITIATTFPDRQMFIAFQGTIDAFSGRLNLTNSSIEVYAEIASGSHQPEILIWLNDLKSPSKVWIAIPTAQ